MARSTDSTCTARQSPSTDGDTRALGETPQPQTPVDDVHVETLRVEVVADPVDHLLVALVIRIPERVEQLGVTPRYTIMMLNLLSS